MPDGNKEPQPKQPYTPPSWSGKAPSGTHLNVMKGDRLVEKLLIDEKKYYLFGRNPDCCDFVIEHSSCSRVHAALLYHKHLKRMFIVDLGSTHGSFIGKVRLEPHKPTPAAFDCNIHFGASTRYYVLKEKPQNLIAKDDANRMDDDQKYDLPEGEEELDNLTEYNTAHNKRVTTLPVVEESQAKYNKRKRKSVTFNEEEMVINPEDVDPTVGRFRNMISVQVIPSKKSKADTSGLVPNHPTSEINKRLQQFYNEGLYDELNKPQLKKKEINNRSNQSTESNNISGFSLPVPNLAPDIEMDSEIKVPVQTSLSVTPSTHTALTDTGEDARPRKKYVKEAWPGRKPSHALLV